MKDFIYLLLCLTSGVMAVPPNLVWIIADDMSPDTGAYGVPQVRTPNLDQMAAGGRIFTRAYSTAPVCSSSRSAFILGCYQTTTGLHPHDVENPQPLAEPYTPLPTLLREAGWFVTNAAAPGSERSGKVTKKAKTHYNFSHNPSEMFDGDDWRKRKAGQPFFAQFQITEPHRPFPIPKEFDEAKLKAIELPPNYPDHPLMRRDWYAYHRSVEVVDQRVGAILQQLRDEGVLHNTVVVFFADHGRPMPWGKQWLSVEGLQVPLIMHGPQVAPSSTEKRLVSLIDLAPTMLKLAGVPVPAWMQGQPVLGETFAAREHVFAARDRCGDAMDCIRAVITENHWLVQHFHPQVSRLNWSGYKEASYPGMPLLRVLHENQTLDSFQQTWLAPRRPEWEFFDLRTDPLGIHDVANDPSSADVLAELQKSLSEWIKTSGDCGLGGDPATEPSMDLIKKDKRADYERTWNARIKKAQPSDGERLAWWMRSYGLTDE